MNGLLDLVDSQTITKFLVSKTLEKDKPQHLYRMLKVSLLQLENTQADSKNQQQKQFIRIYLKVLDSISSDLIKAKKQYENLDKQKLKLDKSLKLATQINIFRDQCYFLKAQLNKATKILKQQRQINSVLSKQVQALAINNDRQQTKSKLQKRNYQFMRNEITNQISYHRKKEEKQFEQHDILDKYQNPQKRIIKFQQLNKTSYEVTNYDTEALLKSVQNTQTPAKNTYRWKLTKSEKKKS